MRSKGILETYRGRINLPAYAVPLSLGEGGTPLIPVPKIASLLGGGFDLFIKFEGLNPTGSFKDRGMVAAVSEAVGRGAKTIICASTGNTAASAAAYAARAGIQAVVLIPEGKVARGKLAAAAAYGANVVQIDGSFDDALRLVREIAEKLPIALVNSINPFRLEGQKTAAFEICEELGTAPDMLAIPVGNAGNITAYHLGFKESGAGVPKMLGVQAKGAAPLVYGKIIEKPETVATAIRIGNPARGKEALAIVAETKGKIMAVSDKEILNARDILAAEGIWVEPASAAGLAGLLKEKFELRNKKVVLVCTGHGLKDPDSVSLPATVKIKPDIKSLERVIKF